MCAISTRNGPTKVQLSPQNFTRRIHLGPPFFSTGATCQQSRKPEFPFAHNRACHPKVGTGFGKNDTHKQRDSATKLLQRFVPSARACHPKVGTGFGKNDTHKQRDKKLLQREALNPKVGTGFGKMTRINKEIARRSYSNASCQAPERIPEKCVAVFG